MAEDDEGSKEVSAQVLNRSVVDVPAEPAAGAPPTTSPLLFFVAQAADEFTTWGRMPKVRDRELRAFIPKESLFSSALGIVCARNAAFSWSLKGPPLTVKRFQRIFEASNFGGGWHDLILQVSFDLYTQDTGAFIEVIRAADSPESPFLGLHHLDAARCYHTGSPEAPVIYEDDKGIFHGLKWWNVLVLRDLPVPGAKGLQVCALSRLLLAAQIVRNIAIFRREKVGGRNTNALHLVQGITTGEITDAMDKAKANADAKGLLRYMSPVIVGSKDPGADVAVQTLELASLPDGFNEDSMYKWYINQIAMGFETDYQEFAPLPGGSLGTSTQSEILHLKSRGKGPGLFMKLISHALNMLVLPDNVTFEFDEQDLEAEKAEAEVAKIRAETRKMDIESGVLTPEGGRQQALDAGDLSQELFDALDGSDLTPNVTLDDDTKPPPNTEHQTVVAEEGEKAERAGPFEEERLLAERRFGAAVERALKKIQANVVRRLRVEGSKEFLLGLKALSDIPEDEAFWVLQREEMLRETAGQAVGLLQAGASQARQLGLATTFDLVNEDVLAFAGQYTDEWWNALSATTRRGLRTAIQTHIETGAPLKSLIESIEPLFGRSRAEMIASTEVTRLYAEGNVLAYQSAGVEEVEWRTVRDALVDPICDALDKQRWPAQQIGQKPPAHPNCRCWLAPVVQGRPRVRPSEGLQYRTFEDMNEAQNWAADNFADTSPTIKSPIFTRKEQLAMEEYKSLSFSDINGWARGTDKSAFNQAAFERNRSMLDSAIRKQVLPGNTTTYRGISRRSWNKLTEGIADLKDLTGAEITDDGYVSTTLNKEFAEDWKKNGVLLEIQAPKGTETAYLDISQIGDTPNEFELLFGRSQTFQIKDITIDAKGAIQKVIMRILS